MRRVAEEAGEKVVQPLRRPPREEHGEPVRDRGQRGHDAPEPEPDDVREREQEPEEDGEPRAAEIVRHDDADWIAAHVTIVRRPCAGSSWFPC